MTHGSSTRHIYGRHPVSEVLRARPHEITKLYVADAGESTRFAELLRLAEQHGITVSRLNKRALENLVGENAQHQGIVAAVVPFVYADVDTMLARAAEQGTPPLLMALDHIQDPHNLGSLIRSSYALGAHGLLMPRDRSCEITSTVVKSSAGATAHLPIAQVTNLCRTLDELKTAGLWVVGAVANEGQALHTIDPQRGLVVVIGSEGKGLRRLVRETCDILAHIPMAGSLGSLNASVAGAVCLYEIVRQRRG